MVMKYLGCYNRNICVVMRGIYGSYKRDIWLVLWSNIWWFYGPIFGGFMDQYLVVLWTNICSVYGEILIVFMK